MNMENFEVYYKNLAMLDKILTEKQIAHYTCVQERFAENVGFIIVITKENQIIVTRESSFDYVVNELNSLIIYGSKIQKSKRISVDDALNVILKNI